VRREIYVSYAQCVTGKFVKMLWGKDKIQVALERLDRLTKDEGLSAVAQTLGVVNKTKRSLFLCPVFVAETDGIL
jgi:hypothetical protein